MKENERSSWRAFQTIAPGIQPTFGPPRTSNDMRTNRISPPIRPARCNKGIFDASIASFDATTLRLPQMPRKKSPPDDDYTSFRFEVTASIPTASSLVELSVNSTVQQNIDRSVGRHGSECHALASGPTFSQRIPLRRCVIAHCRRIRQPQRSNQEQESLSQQLRSQILD